MAFSILVINPGSTSSKLALYEDERCAREESLSHEGEDFLALPASEQLPAREERVNVFLTRAGDPICDAVVGRGGPLRPLAGGSYRIDDALLADLRSARWGEHASLLGGLLAARLAARWDAPAFVVDPISVDELAPAARLSGLPEIERSGRSHALNLKATARRAAAECGKALEDTCFVAAHMGGGISVAALRGGRIEDVNDALLGMGPFSPYRAGALPLRGLLGLAFAPGAERAALERRLSNESGLTAYLGTGDLREVEKRLAAGDERARAAFDAMLHQIAKEIGAMAAALSGRLDGVILTGGMSRCEPLVAGLREQVSFLGEIFHYPGEMEMEALARGALRVLRGEEEALAYGDAAAPAPSESGAPAKREEGSA